MFNLLLLNLPGEGLGQPHYATPFLAPNCTGRTILYGVNYASGGGGIMNGTGRVFVSVDHQFNYFCDVVVQGVTYFI